jgi:L-asparaginase
MRPPNADATLHDGAGHRPAPGDRSALFQRYLAMNLRILATGGTFDKRYDPTTGALGFGETHLHEIVARARVAGPLEIEVLMMIDSLEMTEEDRNLIAHQCNACEEKKIVITHGTDTMAETARVLAENVRDKTIILTGAMIPIKFGSSDGLFNLGSALAFVQTLAPGVYVAMNGKYFTWDNVRKNKETGMFEEVK